jgi:hypothetical protein
MDASDTECRSPAVVRQSWIAVAVLTLACLGLGNYAVRLNAHFYERNQPFFDSMAYHENIHRVMATTREKGLLTALGKSCHSATVCLPFVIAAFLGLVFEPSRAIGIWIQIGELLILAWSLYYYLHRVRRLSPAFAALAITPFLCLRCLFFFNGGLSDFRMDLSSYLLFATTATWYLIATQTQRLSHYVLLGLACGATCLFRATAPIIFVAALGPVAVADLWIRQDRWRVVRGLATAGGIAAVTSLWFFILNFDLLYYYYVVWNTDANANLPLSESVQHLSFVVWHVGVPAFRLLVCFQLIVLLDAALTNRPRAWLQWLGQLRPWQVDWRLLWIGAAPVLFLVLRGAGLNAFVSMPAVFGLTLFLLFPLRAKWSQKLSWPALVAVAVVAIICANSALRRGWRDHKGGEMDSMAAHRRVLDVIVADATRTGQHDVAYTTLHCLDLHPQSLHSVASFDLPGAEAARDAAICQGVRFSPRPGFSVAAAADWSAVPGDSDEAKLHSLTQRAADEVQYLILLEESSARAIQREFTWQEINLRAVAVREMALASGRWVPISESIPNSKWEVVRVYRNTNLQVARKSQ